MALVLAHLYSERRFAPVLLLVDDVHSMGSLDLYLGANHACSRLVVRAHHLHHLLATKHDLPLHHPSNHQLRSLPDVLDLLNGMWHYLVIFWIQWFIMSIDVHFMIK